MDFMQQFLAELKMEAATTRRVLERVPGDRLTWVPHQKSRSLGTLSWHLATIPGRIAQGAEHESWDATANPSGPHPATPAEIVSELDAGVTRAVEVLSRFDKAILEGPIRMHARGKTVFEGKRKVFLRAVLMSHSIHHRGQLSVYLRLLDVPVPAIYGPSADSPLS
jgi:uncharacterized damage-inducible protein DinB